MLASYYDQTKTSDIEIAWISNEFKNRLRACLVSHTMQTNPAVEQNKKR